MTDTPSSILLTREMSTGSQTNLWGGYLITTQRATERASKGYQAYPVTGDATISWTNYSATNDLAVAMVKFGGTPSASWALTLPSYQSFFGSWNNSGIGGTVKNSGGTGKTIPTGRKALLYGDATDIGEASPNWLSDYVATPTQSGDIIVKATSDAAIAAAIAAASITVSGQVLNSVTDTTPGYLGSKVDISASGLTIGTYSTESGGGNEKQLLTLDDRRARRRAYFIGQV